MHPDAIVARQAGGGGVDGEGAEGAGTARWPTRRKKGNPAKARRQGEAHAEVVGTERQATVRSGSCPRGRAVRAEAARPATPPEEEALTEIAARTSPMEWVETTVARPMRRRTSPWTARRGRGRCRVRESWKSCPACSAHPGRRGSGPGDRLHRGAERRPLAPEDEPTATAKTAHRRRPSLPRKSSAPKWPRLAEEEIRWTSVSAPARSRPSEQVTERRVRSAGLPTPSASTATWHRPSPPRASRGGDHRRGPRVAVGPRDRTLLAVQDLTRLAAQRHIGAGSPRARPWTGRGHRQRLVEALRRFSEQVAQQVVETGLAALEPMAAADRKVVHDALNDVDGVRTASEGEEALPPRRDPSRR